ncbi:unnamed protein product, partial [marine sediment metagenome]
MAGQYLLLEKLMQTKQIVVLLKFNSGRGGGSGQSYLIRGEVAVRVSGNIIYNENFGTVNYRLLTIRNAADANVTAVKGYLEGTALTELSSSGAVINTLANGTAIGGFGGGSPELEGRIAEIIVYNTELDDLQRIIIENYVAAKYDLTIIDDHYAYESTHSNDVAGIGRLDVDTLHTVSQSAKILNIGNASGLGDDEFLFFGHDNGSAASWSTSEVPGSDTNIRRIAREWRLDETGNIGMLKISIDTSLFPSKPSNFTKYVLWLDADGDFSSGA